MKLTEKLLRVMQECSHIGKDAVNDEVGYPYVSAAKINDAVNRALINNGIATTAESKLVDIRTIEDKIFAAVEVTIALYDTDSGETLTIKGVGTGIDTSDKSVAKAQTMAVKYAWKDSLLIADSADDPDAVNGKVNYTAKPRAVRNSATLNKINVPF